MNPWLMAVALMTTALAGPLASQGWSAEEIQVIRKGAPAGTQMLPFTTYQKEVQAVMQALPCKWISMDGRVGPSYGSGRYDFLCKGGDWATVSLFIDKSSSDGVGRVRLLYREWQDNIHPNAGEAFVAQQYLQHVVNHFVPASAAGAVMESFWQGQTREWSGNGVAISFKVDERKDYVVRILNIAGTSSGVAARPVVLGQPQAAQPATVPAKRPMTLEVVPQPLVTPTDAGLRKDTLPEVEAPAQAPAVVLPQAPVSLPVPQEPGVPVLPLTGGLQVPPNAPAAQVTSTLIRATPAELNTAPAPESLEKPKPLPPVSSSLVPNAESYIGGRERAPSSFDAYNRAVELTKDIEKKAMIVAPDKVKSATPQSQAQATASKPAAAPAAKPHAEVPVGIERMRPSEPGLPKDATVVAPPAPKDPRFTPLRPLPQLKFIPKAEPLGNPGRVIEFEDEDSTL